MNPQILIPEKGFYYHYKHDPKGAVNNYAYEVIGVGFHTEERTYNVIYRPLYKNTFLGQAEFCVRPYEMFMGNVELEGRVVPRFQKITDERVIKELLKLQR